METTPLSVGCAGSNNSFCRVLELNKYKGGGGGANGGALSFSVVSVAASRSDGAITKQVLVEVVEKEFDWKRIAVHDGGLFTVVVVVVMGEPRDLENVLCR